MINNLKFLVLFRSYRINSSFVIYDEIFISVIIVPDKYNVFNALILIVSLICSISLTDSAIKPLLIINEKQVILIYKFKPT
jgi:hypothetical protein